MLHSDVRKEAGALDDIQMAENATGGVSRLASDAEVIILISKACAALDFYKVGGKL